VPYRFLSSDMVVSGELIRHRYKVLLLPDAISLSPAEASEIRRFIRAGGLVAADVEPGTFDRHGRKLVQGLLHDVFKSVTQGAAGPGAFGHGKATYVPINSLGAENEPSTCVSRAAVTWMTRLLAIAGVTPTVLLNDSTGTGSTDVRRYFFQSGEAMILALHRDLCSSLTDVKGEPDPRVHLVLPRASFLYDVRAKLALGKMDELPLELSTVEPTILAISRAPMPSLRITGPKRVHPGDIASLRVIFAGPRMRALHILHVDVSDPFGRSLTQYSTNILSKKREVSQVLALAHNDPVGIWRVRATDVLSGVTATWELHVTDRQ
jgi:hypothetical protein